eukprot:COSAG02_NODE_307_length_25111_cov_5.306693_4_plen_93_part_00
MKQWTGSKPVNLSATVCRVSVCAVKLYSPKCDHNPFPPTVTALIFLCGNAGDRIRSLIPPVGRLCFAYDDGSVTFTLYDIRSPESKGCGGAT